MDGTTVLTTDTLMRLRRLPPTAELRADLERLEAAVAAGMRDDRGMFATEHRLTQARRLLRNGEERDELQAQRPAGCMCLGLGLTDLRTFCRCPEGVAAEVEAKEYALRRRQEAVEHAIERAGIPAILAGATFETYPGPTATAARLRDWRPAEEGPCRGLYLWGPWGTGKSGAAVSLLRAYVERTALQAAFVPVPHLLHQLRSTFGAEERGQEAETALMRRATSPCLVVLDDIGAERPSDWVEERLYLIVATRHDNLYPTVFTSNLAIKDLAPRLGGRICSRIVEMAEMVKVAGPDLRTREGNRA